MIKLTEKKGVLTFSVKVQPRASRNQVVGELDGALKIKIAAPPVEGKANAERQRFLATLFGVSRSDVKIVAGETSKTKVVQIRGLDHQRFSDIIKREIGE